MDAVVELASMQRLITDHGTSAAVKEYSSLCEKHSKYATEINAIEIEHYLDRMFGAYCKALKRARNANAKAIYFEYDLDNDWNSNFFVCPAYKPIQAGDDDWACDYISASATPGIFQFAEIYAQFDGFCIDDESTSATLHMIARTADVVSSVINRKLDKSIAMCIGFHDQDPIHRIANGG